MRQRKFRRVQHEPRRGPAVVAAVAEDRGACRCKMNTNLVPSSGRNAHAQERVITGTSNALPARVGRLAVDRLGETTAARRQTTADHGVVVLLDVTLP